MTTLAALLVWFTSWFAAAAPPVSRGHFAEHVRMLALTDDADVIRVQDAYEVYVATIEDAEEAEQLLYRWQMPVYTNHPEQGGAHEVITGDQRHINNSVEQLKFRAYEAYFDALRTALPGREEQIAALDRAQYRLWHLSQAMGAGMEGLPDLIWACEQVAPDAHDRPELEAALRRFDLAFDAIARPSFAWRVMDRRDERQPLIEAGDLEGLTAWWTEFYQPQAEMHDLVLRTIRGITALLSEPEAAAFRTMCEERLYADIVRPTRMDQLLATAFERDDLTEAQRERLHALSRTLESRRATERARLMAQSDAMSGLDGVHDHALRSAESALGLVQGNMTDVARRHHKEVQAYRTIGAELEEALQLMLEENGEATP